MKPSPDLLLPYAGDAQAADLLAQVVAQLGASVAGREPVPGAAFWSFRLSDYLELQKLNLPLQTHLALIRLLYELATLETLDLLQQEHWAQMLVRLLRKPHLIPEGSLVLPWRPLYKLLKDNYFQKCREFSRISNDNHAHAIAAAVRACRRYFPPESAQEMLEEWRPLLCPHDSSLFKGTAFLGLFLPTMPVADTNGPPAWFAEIWALWDLVENMPEWNLIFVTLFARFVKYQPDAIKWTPDVMSSLYCQFLRFFDLPVGSVATAVPEKHALPEDCLILLPTGDKAMAYLHRMCNLLIRTLQPGQFGSGSLLRAFMHSIESFFHPSNSGRWTNRLSMFLQSIVARFARRLQEERAAGPTGTHWNGHRLHKPEFRLNEQDCRDFVETMRPVAMLSMFGKGRVALSAALTTIKTLADIHAPLVIPMLLERIYPALETLTEVNTTVSAISCLYVLARKLVDHRGTFPEGITHLLPLLNLTLPGIDANDLHKTGATLQFYSSVLISISIYDCSSVAHDYMEEWKQESCLSTCGFEDWVVQLLDRCFLFIENQPDETAGGNRDGNGKASTSEDGLSASLVSMFTLLFWQLSPALYTVALHRVHSHYYNSMKPNALKVCGLLYAAVSAPNPVEALHMMIPSHTEKVCSALRQNEGVLADGSPDDELTWHMRLLSQCVKNCGPALIPHLPAIEETIQLCLNSNCHRLVKLAGKMLRNTLRALVNIYPSDLRLLTSAERSSLKTVFESWGRVVPDADVDPQWHVPSEEECQSAVRLLQRFFEPALQMLLQSQLPEGARLSKIDLQHTLLVIFNCMRGVAAAAPEWDADECEMAVSTSPKSRFPLVFPRYKTAPPDRNYVATHPYFLELRDQVGTALLQTAQHLSLVHEDNTKALRLLLKITGTFLNDRGARSIQAIRRQYDMVKMVYYDRTYDVKQMPRPFRMQRAYLQHLIRLNKNRMSVRYHMRLQTLLMAMVDLATSGYARVRSRAQTILSGCIAGIRQSRYDILQHALAKLPSFATPTQLVNDDCVKGVMYLLNLRPITMTIVCDWYWQLEVVKKLFALHFIEKPSVQALINKVFNSVSEKMYEVPLGVTIPPVVVDIAVALSGDAARVDEAAILAVAEAERQRNLALFREMQRTTLDMLKSGEIHWRYEVMISAFLGLMIRSDTPVNTETVEYAMNTLSSDSVMMRKWGIMSMNFVFLLLKSPSPKIAVSIDQITVGPQQQLTNEFMSAMMPRDKASWESALFVDKNNLGWHHTFAASPAAYSYSPEVLASLTNDRPVSVNLEAREAVKTFFSNSERVHRMLSFLDQDQSSNHDDFSVNRAQFFKGLFSVCGDAVVDAFRPDLERFCQAGAERWSQRTACEILGGLVRGSKHWSFESQERLWAYLTPLLQKAIDGISNETLDNWTAAVRFFVYDRDPKRLYWLTDLLLAPVMSWDRVASFAQFRRLQLVHTILDELNWRGSEPSLAWLERLEGSLDHQYKLVREKIGRCIFSISRSVWDPYVNIGHPNVHEFVRKMLVDWTNARAEEAATLMLMSRSVSDIGLHAMSADNLARNGSMDVDAAPPTPSNLVEEKRSVKIAKTVLNWLMWSFHYSSTGTCLPYIQELIPMMFAMFEHTSDEELQKLLRHSLGLFSQCRLPVSYIDVLLKLMKSALVSTSWRTKTAALHFLQVSVFRNLFLLTHDHLAQVVDILHTGLVDPLVEVQQLAAITFSGLLRCDARFIEIETVLTQFRKLAKTKLLKINTSSSPSDVATAKKNLIQRHAGVLGLSALVQASPYGLPSWMPAILVELGDFVNDPVPIKQTVHKTLSEFWRTHQDSWVHQKSQFTEDQLIVLTDLLISPNYYA